MIRKYLEMLKYFSDSFNIKLMLYILLIYMMLLQILSSYYYHFVTELKQPNAIYLL